MSLVDEMMSDFEIINKSVVDDPEGGTQTIWTDGATIQAVAVKDSSMQAKIAEAQGVTSVYTIVTSKENALDFHTVLRRKSDGTIFRITEEDADNKTPESSNLDIKKLSAEKWRLPT